MNTQKIAKQILSGFSDSVLKKQYSELQKELKKSDASSLSIKDLRSLVAYEFLKDGAEKDFVDDVLKGKIYKTKLDLLKQLQQVFGYKV
jgi:hypothetical protein